MFIIFRCYEEEGEAVRGPAENTMSNDVGNQEKVN